MRTYRVPGTSLRSCDAVNKTRKFAAFMELVLERRRSKLADLEGQKEGKCDLNLVQKGESDVQCRKLVQR